MPCIWGQHNGKQLFLLVVILPENAPVAPASPIGVPALIDTGATTSGIASTLAAQLQMQPIGLVSIQGVGGVQQHNSYLFKVAFPFALTPPLPPGHPPPQPGQMAAQLFVSDTIIQGCEFHAGNAPFQVILGMDVLSTGSLVVQGNGTFSFSF
jgi:hypothetical protein